MKMLIAIFVMFFSFNLSAEFDNKCSILITLRFQNNENAYADALDKILIYCLKLCQAFFGSKLLLLLFFNFILFNFSI